MPWCHECRAETNNGKHRCDGCKIKQMQRDVVRLELRYLADLCRDCNNKRKGDFVRCEECIIKNNKRNNDYYRSGKRKKKGI